MATRAILPAAMLLALTSGSVLAQQAGNPAVMAPDTPKTAIAQPPADHPNTVDQLFARQLLIGGDAEVELGKLAGSKAKSSAVKDFAKRMVEDHSKANEQLLGLARANRADQPRGGASDPDAAAVKDQLQKLSGADFDAAYIAAQVGDHQKTVHLLEHEIGSGQDQKMQDYAKKTLPTVMRHLEMARQIQSDLAYGKGG
jgi:putative membrane protein